MLTVVITSLILGSDLVLAGVVLLAIAILLSILNGLLDIAMYLALLLGLVLLGGGLYNALWAAVLWPPVELTVTAPPLR